MGNAVGSIQDIDPNLKGFPTEFTLVGQIQNGRLGRGNVYEHHSQNIEIFEKVIPAETQEILHKWTESLKRHQTLNSQYTVKLLGYRIHEDEAICATRGAHINAYYEYFEETLQQRLDIQMKKQILLKEAAVIYILYRVSKLMCFLYSKNHYENNVSLDTILLTQRGEVKVLPNLCFAQDQDIKTRVVTGQLDYIDPSLLAQCLSQNLSSEIKMKIDSYALGLVLLQLCSLTKINFQLKLNPQIQAMQQIMKDNYSKGVNGYINLLISPVEDRPTFIDIQTQLAPYEHEILLQSNSTPQLPQVQSQQWLQQQQPPQQNMNLQLHQQIQNTPQLQPPIQQPIQTTIQQPIQTTIQHSIQQQQQLHEPIQLQNQQQNYQPQIQNQQIQLAQNSQNLNFQTKQNLDASVNPYHSLPSQPQTRSLNMHQTMPQVSRSPIKSNYPQYNQSNVPSLYQSSPTMSFGAATPRPFIPPRMSQPIKEPPQFKTPQPSSPTLPLQASSPNLIKSQNIQPRLQQPPPLKPVTQLPVNIPKNNSSIPPPQNIFPTLAASPPQNQPNNFQPLTSQPAAPARPNIYLQDPIAAKANENPYEYKRPQDMTQDIDQRYQRALNNAMQALNK